MAYIRFILLALLAWLGVTPAESPPGAFTMMLRSDDGVVALVWDGHLARVFLDGHPVDQYPSPTAEGAVWRLTTPSSGGVSGPRWYDAPLADEQIAAMAICDWAPTTQASYCDRGDPCPCDALQPGPWSW